ncbi:hypothetical protein RF11_13904 [Thelohanellus kitauei]|uniref:Uncharacterized protein n=1 Tax=Thelohanellus kitauei TaxID=669202 RepID=A0A0C2MGX5_THEKT|nr:hypothetical protein RF11_13904 [Thelohanellus kitauei]
MEGERRFDVHEIPRLDELLLSDEKRHCPWQISSRKEIVVARIVPRSHNAPVIDETGYYHCGTDTYISSLKISHGYVCTLPWSTQAITSSNVKSESGLIHVYHICRKKGVPNKRQVKTTQISENDCTGWI